MLLISLRITEVIRLRCLRRSVILKGIRSLSFVMSGYLLFGISLRMVLAFVASYWMAERAADSERLRAMNYRYDKEFRERFDSEQGASEEDASHSQDGVSATETLYPQRVEEADE